jgi:hypothetical protein
MSFATKAEIARSVLEYLSEHPDAQDTLEGIVEWWLVERRVVEQWVSVREVLDELVRAQLLVSWDDSGARTFYGLKRPRAGQIPSTPHRSSSESRPARPRRPGPDIRRQTSAASEKEISRMASTIQNRARHLLILPLNSGGTLHLVPGETSAPVEDFDIERNEKVERLLKDGLIAVTRSQDEQHVAAQPVAAPDEHHQAAGVEEHRRPSRRN